ncbi:hypothetical protein A0H81_04882 [Grifola frondosa]|uniref:HMG box domain-containing protein n=1 Tax=Grifola frondosa TaxID=5627 RepID=A0A1C7MEZ1_GRIFR|nr:hypothetical protein A0H81_04882 [Grifola frondosa]
MSSPTSTRAGGICGWAPSNEDHDDALTYSPVYQHSNTSMPVLSSIPLQSAPPSRSSSFDTTPPLSRSSSHGMLEEPVYSHYTNPSSERRARLNRERDPTWVPRPPNAFILFRARYSQKHARTTGEPGRAHANEKSLSKRAAEAWKKLSPEEKEPYKTEAERERQEHARRHPNYRYKPRRRHSDTRRGAGLSRRDMVESFVASRNGTMDDCLSPSSQTSSSSPEPPGTPRSEGAMSEPIFQQGRSCSLPPPFGGPVPGPYLSLPACASTPCLVPQQPTLSRRRSRSLIDTSAYTAMDFLGFPEDYLDSDDAYLSFELFGQPSPTTSLQEAFFDQMSLNVTAPTIQITTTPEGPATSQDFIPSSSYPPMASPLFNRRQRSATTPSVIPPSPLAVVTSSLAGWNTENCTPTNPASFQHPSSQTNMLPPEVTGTPAAWGQPSIQMSPVAGCLTVPGLEIDLDRTPRNPTFPLNVHSTYLPPPAERSSLAAYLPSVPHRGVEMAGAGGSGADAYDVAAAFDSYAAGLQDLGIQPMEAVYNMSPFEEVDFGVFFHDEPRP